MDAGEHIDRNRIELGAGPLDAESDSRHHCEGEVVTCAHCGRPAPECDGSRCEHLLDTRDWMVPGYSSA